MKVTQNIHALKIPFEIRDQLGRILPRFVYSYIVFGEKITLIDTGVKKSEESILKYIREHGRDIQDIDLIIHTHAHPDHIGASIALKKATYCKTAIHTNEKEWIENIQQQFSDRPVPGFFELIEGSCPIEQILKDGETIHIDSKIILKVIHTPGHSKGSISLFSENDQALICGDAIPVLGEMPIYDDISDSIQSIEKLIKFANQQSVQFLLSSWDHPRGQGDCMKSMNDGLSYLRTIHNKVQEITDKGRIAIGMMDLCAQVVKDLGLPPYCQNPLVAKALLTSIE